MKEFLPKELQALQLTDSEARALYNLWRDAIRFEKWEFVGIYGQRHADGDAYVQWLFEELFKFYPPIVWRPLISAIRNQAKAAGNLEIYEALTETEPKFIEHVLTWAKDFDQKIANEERLGWLEFLDDVKDNFSLKLTEEQISVLAKKFSPSLYYERFKVLEDAGPVLIFERLFDQPEYMEKTLAALRDLGIIDAGNRWSYGKKKAAICAALAVLKRRQWFDKDPPDVELAQCFAAFLGTTIGESTVYEYTPTSPKYAVTIKADLDMTLPNE